MCLSSCTPSSSSVTSPATVAWTPLWAAASLHRHPTNGFCRGNFGDGFGGLSSHCSSFGHVISWVVITPLPKNHYKKVNNINNIHRTVSNYWLRNGEKFNGDSINWKVKVLPTKFFKHCGRDLWLWSSTPGSCTYKPYTFLVAASISDRTEELNVVVLFLP